MWALLYHSERQIDSLSKIQQGVNVLIAGLALQILSLVGFFGLWFWFMSRVLRKREFLDPRFCSVYLSARFKTALLCKSNFDDKVWNPKHMRNHIPRPPLQTPATCGPLC